MRIIQYYWIAGKRKWKWMNEKESVDKSMFLFVAVVRVSNNDNLFVVWGFELYYIGFGPSSLELNE